MFKFTPACCCNQNQCGSIYGLQENGPSGYMPQYFADLNNPRMRRSTRDIIYQAFSRIYYLGGIYAGPHPPIPNNATMWGERYSGYPPTPTTLPDTIQTHDAGYIAAYNRNCTPITSNFHRYEAKIRPWSSWYLENALVKDWNGGNTRYHIMHDISFTWDNVDTSSSNIDWYEVDGNYYDINAYTKSYPDFNTQFSLFGYNSLGWLLAYDTESAYYNPYLNKIKALLSSVQLSSTRIEYSIGFYDDDSYSMIYPYETSFSWQPEGELVTNMGILPALAPRYINNPYFTYGGNDYKFRVLIKCNSERDIIPICQAIAMHPTIDISDHQDYNLPPPWNIGGVYGEPPESPPWVGGGRYGGAKWDLFCIGMTYCSLEYQ